MSVHALKHENADELLDLEYLAHVDVSEERGQVIDFPIQPPGMMSVDEKLYQRFDECFEAPAYENLAFEEDFTPAKEVLER